MDNKINNIDLSRKIFALAICSTVLDEINSGESRGRIVRRLVKDGYSVEYADFFYQSIIQNKNLVEMKVKLWNQEIKAECCKYEDRVYLLKLQEDKRTIEELRHLVWHGTSEILNLIVLKIFGVN